MEQMFIIVNNIKCEKKITDIIIVSDDYDKMSNQQCMRSTVYEINNVLNQQSCNCLKIDLHIVN